MLTGNNNLIINIYTTLKIECTKCILRNKCNLTKKKITKKTTRKVAAATNNKLSCLKTQHIENSKQQR